MKCRNCKSEIVFKDGQWCNMRDPWGYACPAGDFGHEPEEDEVVYSTTQACRCGQVHPV